MTDKVSIDPADRELWDRYVRLRRDRAPQGAGEAGAIDGRESLEIAAYLDHRLDEYGRAAVEARLADDPLILEAALSAREAGVSGYPPEQVPQAVTAFALNLGAEHAPARQHVAAPPGSRRWRLNPAFAYGMVTAAFLGAFAAGALVAWQLIEPPATAWRQDPASGADKASKKLSDRGESIFDDPARTIYDGLDVKD